MEYTSPSLVGRFSKKYILPSCLKAKENYGILFCWLVELTGFSGHSFQDACRLAEWVLSEMESSFPERTKLLGQTKKIRERLPQTLSFLQRMEESLGAAA